jgi:hypothetical protein
MARRLSSGEAPKLILLSRCLIIKSIIDVLLVGGFAIGLYYSAFNPSLRGGLDEAGPQWVNGWVINQSAPDTHVEVQLYIDGRLEESRLADFPYPNLMKMGLTKDERHGFFFYTPPLDQGEHEARVYAVHESASGERRTLQLLGRPLRFTVDAAPAEPYFRGWLDTASAQTVTGWVVNRDQPDKKVEVHLYIDGHFVESRSADYPRPDLKAGRLFDDERHGFFFYVPAQLPGEHEARIYAPIADSNGQGRTLRLIGRPVKFKVEP